MKSISIHTLESFGYIYSQNSDKWIIKDFAIDYIFLGDNDIGFTLPLQLKAICSLQKWKKLKDKSNYFPNLTIQEYNESDLKSLKFISIYGDELIDNTFLSKLKKDDKAVIILSAYNGMGFLKQRGIILKLIELSIKNPLIVRNQYECLTTSQLQVNASIDLGGMFIDGFGDGLMISHDSSISFKDSNLLCFQILQSTRTRITKTDYISCPSCGRTQFDLMKTTALVREKTSHLKGLKIAVMGCIVNGPGEMADADYGYVGTGFQKISLYKKHNVVKKNINSNIAVNELIKLIKDNGDWVKP